MGVWLPDGWMEDAPGDFPLTPLISPGPPSLPAAGREGGKRVGFGGGGFAAAPKPHSLPAAGREGGPGGMRGVNGKSPGASSIQPSGSQTPIVGCLNEFLKVHKRRADSTKPLRVSKQPAGLC